MVVSHCTGPQPEQVPLTTEPSLELPNKNIFLNGDNFLSPPVSVLKSKRKC